MILQKSFKIADFLLLSMLKTVVLINILLWNRHAFFSGFYDEQKFIWPQTQRLLDKSIRERPICRNRESSFGHSWVHVTLLWPLWPIKWLCRLLVSFYTVPEAFETLRSNLNNSACACWPQRMCLLTPVLSSWTTLCLRVLWNIVECRRTHVGWPMYFLVCLVPTANSMIFSLVVCASLTRAGML